MRRTDNLDLQPKEYDAEPRQRKGMGFKGGAHRESFRSHKG
jgi:hypothetical protein